MILCVRTACGRQQVNIKARTLLQKKKRKRKEEAKDRVGEKQKA